MENQQKKASYKALCSTITLLVMLLLSINLVVAFEFDNVKNYDEATKTITITNAFGLGSDIASVTLKSDLVEYVMVGKDRKVAEFEINNYYENYPLAIKELELFNIDRSMKKINRAFIYKYAEKIDLVSYPISETICNYDLKTDKEIGDSCYNEIIEYYEKEIITWREFDTTKDLPKGKIRIGIFTNVYKGDNVEWIPNLFGERINEWAAWSEGLKVGVLFDYEFDETSGTDVEDTVAGEINGTTNGAWTTGVRDNAVSISRYLNVTIERTTGDAAGSWEIWFNADAANIDSRPLDTGVQGDNTMKVLNIIEGPVRARFMGNTGGLYDASYSPSIAAGAWYQFILTWSDNGNLSIYVNGTIAAVTNVAQVLGDSPTPIILGKDDPSVGFAGKIDMFRGWDRVLTDAEITQLYNSGEGLAYEATNVITTTLWFPDDDYLTTSGEILFGVNSSAVDEELTNVTLYVWNSTDDEVSVNYTALSGSDTINTNWTNSYPDGNYTWNAITSGNLESTSWDTNRSFSIDTTAPVLTEILNLTNVTVEIPFSLNWYYNVTDDNVGSCWYYTSDDYTNVSVSCNAEMINTNWTTGGSKTIYYFANDTFGFESEANDTFSINSYFSNATYTDPAVEAESYLFQLVVNATTLTNFNGSFIYNGVSQDVLYSNENNIGTINSTLTLETIGNNSFYWAYYVNDDLITESNYSHIVLAIQNLSVTDSEGCAAGLSEALHYDFKDEQNDTILNTTIDYIFRYGISNDTLRTTAGSITSPSLSVCINSTVYNDYSLGYGEIQYDSSGYSDRRYYTFRGDRLSNTTINNTVHSLVSGSSTSFLFTIQQGDLSVYDDVYLTLNRWYPDEDTYKVVEMARTDDEGQTVMKVEIEDVDYRVGVYYQNGTLIYLAAPFRLVCIASPCSYSLIVPEDAGNSFENWKDLQVSLTFNTTDSIFTMIYNDPSQATDTINLSVYRDTGLSSLLICTDSSNAYTAVLTCNVSGYSGMLKAIGFRTASPETTIISRIVQVGTTALSKTPALFLTFIIMIFLVSIGVVSPILTVILAVLAFIPALIFGIMPLSILLLIVIMGFIVISFMKRSVYSG